MRNIVAFMCLAALMFLGGCGSPGDDDGGTGPGTNPHVAVTTIFSGSAYMVYSVRPEWSPDGGTIVFAGGPSGNIWKVAGTAGSSPVAVTNPDSSAWEYGGYTPCCLADGHIVYYLGWLGNDHDMHIMGAEPTQVRCMPPPVVLRAFNGSDVGMALGAAASPDVLSLSGTGDRGVALWGASLFGLNWGSGTIVASRLSDGIAGPVFDPVISHNGDRIAFADSSRHVVWIPFAGGTPTVVGEGRYPSWSGNGHLLGYVNGNATAYVVHDVVAGTSKSYAIGATQVLQYPCLSWDGTKIAFRTFGGANTGISVGLLSD
jgi:Tol biopolymer transport system component